MLPSRSPSTTKLSTTPITKVALDWPAAITTLAGRLMPASVLLRLTVSALVVLPERTTVPVTAAAPACSAMLAVLSVSASDEPIVKAALAISALFNSSCSTRSLAASTRTTRCQSPATT